MKPFIKKNLTHALSLSIKDSFITLLFFFITLGVCYFLHSIDENDTYVSMLFILAVFMTSRFTNGYLYGIISALASVLAVNFIFTYPYYEFNFTLSGYPLAIISMLAVAITTSMLTSQIKLHSRLKLEAEKEKTRSNLLRAVSHDLRTPLTSILGASSAIIDNDDKLNKAERIKLLSEINEDAQWLIRMVENLLSITRIDDGHNTRIAKMPEAAEEVIAESVSKFRKRFPEWMVSVEVPDDLLMIPMDALLIEQVIINLLENSALHSKTADSISLTVMKNSDSAVFEVKDNGMGISPEILPHIFEGYFKQTYEDDGDAKRNMGIGLSVCYTIIKAHLGTMTAFNNTDGGAVFRFSLPLNDNK